MESAYRAWHNYTDWVVFFLSLLFIPLIYNSPGCIVITFQFLSTCLCKAMCCTQHNSSPTETFGFSQDRAFVPNKQTHTPYAQPSAFSLYEFSIEKVSCLGSWLECVSHRRVHKTISHWKVFFHEPISKRICNDRLTRNLFVVFSSEYKEIGDFSTQFVQIDLFFKSDFDDPLQL